MRNTIFDIFVRPQCLFVFKNRFTGYDGLCRQFKLNTVSGNARMQGLTVCRGFSILNSY